MKYIQPMSPAANREISNLLMKEMIESGLDLILAPGWFTELRDRMIGHDRWDNEGGAIA